MKDMFQFENAKCFKTMAGIFVLVLFCTFTISAQEKKNTNSVSPQVEIAGSQLLHLSSAVTGKDYDLYINLPGSYGDTTKTFPVVFLLDAQWDFPLVSAIYGEQYFDGFLPEMVIVGITWGGKNPNYDKLRAHDFTPLSKGPNETNGNAEKFLSFIKIELIPYVEKKFRVKRNDRTLIGSSLGGLFTLYSMFQEPGLFNRCVLTSPALQWDNKILYSLNKSFAEKHKELPVKVFMGVGEYENVTEFQNFAEELKTKNYKNLELQTKVIAGMGHSGGKAEGYTRGLQTVFARPEIHVDSAVLKTYTGEYIINSMNKATLIQERGKLVAILPDNSRIPFQAENDVDFYVVGQFLKIHVEKDQAGEVIGFTLRQYGGNVFCKKVK